MGRPTIAAIDAQGVVVMDQEQDRDQQPTAEEAQNRLGESSRIAFGTPAQARGASAATTAHVTPYRQQRWIRHACL